jgi:hypothetical protein
LDFSKIIIPLKALSPYEKLFDSFYVLSELVEVVVVAVLAAAVVVIAVVIVVVVLQQYLQEQFQLLLFDYA